MMKRMTSLEWIKENVEDIDAYLEKYIRVGFQKTGTLDSQVMQKSTEFPAIDRYLFLLIENKEKRTVMSTFVTYDFLSSTRYTAEQLWAFAEKNTKNSTQIAHVFDMLEEFKDLLGEEENAAIEEQKKYPMYVVTNKERYKGAACIMNKEAIRDVCKQFSMTNIICMPSSVHEMIFMPYMEGDDLNDISAKVQYINQTIVEPKDRLSDQAFVMELEKKKFLVTYWEAYSKGYEVEASNAEEAEEIVKNNIMDGIFIGPDNCYDSGCKAEEIKESFAFIKQGEIIEISPDLMDAIAVYMDDDIREAVQYDLAPCKPEEFLEEYIRRDPDFTELLEHEFSIEVEE